MIKKIIFTGFAPNLTKRDTLIAIKFLLFPWKWFELINGKYIKIVEKKIQEYFNIKYVYAFDSGRSALYFALKTLGVGKGDEILVQAYTCVVVSNAIIWTEAKPIYVDISDDFNMNPEDLEKKITSKAKALIIQHTFGVPAQLDKLLMIARKYNLKVIEDCAHGFGIKYNNQYIGTFGDIGMLSFGADKSISCVRGGALITDNSELSIKIAQYQDNLRSPSILKTIQHLLHYPIFFISKPLYGIILGKVFLWTAKKLNIFNQIIYNSEKHGKQISVYPSQLPNALARILINQLDEIDKINNHRRKITELYTNFIQNKKIKLPKIQLSIINYQLSMLRFTILTQNPQILHNYVKQHSIILGNWYNAVIVPDNINLKNTGYKIGNCPNAELLASQSINLPTDRHINKSDAFRIIDIINNY